MGIAGKTSETFTDGASVARRHLEKPVTLCLIIYLAVSRRRSILGFRLPLRFASTRFQAASIPNSANTQSAKSGAICASIGSTQIFAGALSGGGSLAASFSVTKI